jgi:hypothetical protein
MCICRLVPAIWTCSRPRGLHLLRRQQHLRLLSAVPAAAQSPTNWAEAPIASVRPATADTSLFHVSPRPPCAPEPPRLPRRRRPVPPLPPTRRALPHLPRHHLPSSRFLRRAILLLRLPRQAPSRHPLRAPLRPPTWRPC